MPRWERDGAAVDEIPKKDREAGEGHKGSRLLTALISVALTGVAFALLSRFVDLARVPARLAATDLRFLPIILVASAAIDSLGTTLRWWLVLRTRAPTVRYADALFVRMGSWTFLALMPLSSGEFVPALYLRRRHGVPALTTLGTVLFDKTITVLALLLLATVGAYRSGLFPCWIPAAGVVLFLFGLIPGVADGMLNLTRLNRTRLAAPISELFACFRSIHPARSAGILAYSVFLQLSIAGVFALYLASQSVTVPLDQTLFLVPSVDLVANLPLTVAGAGTRDAVAALLFSGWALPEHIVGASLLFLLVEMLLALLATLFFLPALLRRLVRHAEKAS
jgi:hypothetical protein